MKYQNGALRVTRPDSDFVFSLEIGQGATTPVFTSDDMEQAVERLLSDKTKPPAFIEALKELQELGRSVDWEWEKISARSEE